MIYMNIIYLVGCFLISFLCIKLTKSLLEGFALMMALLFIWIMLFVGCLHVRL